MAWTGFHSRFPTDVDQEITLAEHLYISARLHHGERLSSRVRRDAAGVFRRFQYCRGICTARDPRLIPFVTVLEGYDLVPESKATAGDILTPDVPAWREFADRLAAELLAPDADWRFAPANRCHCGTAGRCFWPLASAELVRDLGFAIAETLATFVAFHAFNDRGVLDNVERIWRRTRPSRRRSGDRTTTNEG